jgi:NADH-quinone oxidoreductase subunit H
VTGLVRGLVGGTILVTVIMTATAWGLWLERKLAARLQARMGPTMVGWHGLLQPLADLFKLLQKEDIVPGGADRPLFNLAPVMTVVAALAGLAVVPFSAGWVIADLEVGVPWLLAVGGLAVIPVWMAGWASNNKFALLGGMRAVAQSVAYEVPLVLAAMVPVILAGSMSLSDIAAFQAERTWFALWPLVPGLPAFVLFLTALLAESNRIPFDIPEAESELVAGISTEYTGMKFGLFYMAEYVHTIVASAAASALFLGGWDGPFAPGPPWMALKTAVLFVGIYWLRWTLLRFRSDQLMRLCWTWLVPVGLALVLSAALCVTVGNAA